MSEPDANAHKTDDHGSHDSHGHDDQHGHEVATDIIPENSTQDMLLMCFSGIALLGLMYMMYVWMGIALPEVHEGEGEHHAEQRIETPKTESSGEVTGAEEAPKPQDTTNTSPEPPPMPTSQPGAEPESKPAEGQPANTAPATESQPSNTAPAPNSEGQAAPIR